MLYRNKKNGKLYEIIAEAIDATNCRDDMMAVVYKNHPDAGKVFVREADEFYEKFEAVH